MEAGLNSKSLVLFLMVGVGIFLWSPTGAQEPEPAVLSPGADGVQRGTILMESYSFTPHHLIVQVGQPVELTLSNESFLVPHNFILNVPEAGLVIEENVGFGDTLTIQFTPTRAGVYPFYCDNQLLFFPSHREEGMEGHLEVR